MANIITLILSKNEWLGIGIFTDRLFTFLALGVVLLGGVGMAYVMRLLGEIKWK